MTDEQVGKIINAIVSGQRDHDLLIRMNQNLENHLASCAEQKCTIQTHMLESVNVRDDVKSCKDFIGGAKKALWIMFGSLVGIGYKVFFVK